MKKPSVILPFERPIYELEENLDALEKEPSSAQTKESIRNMRVEITHMKKEVFSKLDPWEVVQVARHPDRPQLRDYIELVFDEFVELHGDKSFGDDRALMTGFARLGEHKVMLIGQHKGRTLQERNECYYGCAHPEGYKKALSKMQMAEKYGIPIICLIDTPPVSPGAGPALAGSFLSGENHEQIQCWAGRCNLCCPAVTGPAGLRRSPGVRSRRGDRRRGAGCADF